MSTIDIKPNRWFIVCEVKYPKIFFNKGERISVHFLDFNDKIIEGQINKITVNGESFLASIEFSENIEDFINTRNTSAIIYKSVRGLKIPRDAIVNKRSKTGVYSVQNNESVFIEIEIIAESETSEYVIINNETSLLKEGDNIVIK